MPTIWHRHTCTTCQRSYLCDLAGQVCTLTNGTRQPEPARCWSCFLVATDQRPA